MTSHSDSVFESQSWVAMLRDPAAAAHHDELVDKLHNLRERWVTMRDFELGGQYIEEFRQRTSRLLLPGEELGKMHNPLLRSMRKGARRNPVVHNIKVKKHGCELRAQYRAEQEILVKSFKQELFSIYQEYRFLLGDRFVRHCILMQHATLKVRKDLPFEKLSGQWEDEGDVKGSELDSD